MSTVVDMLVPALILSTGALACLSLLPHAPPRIRFCIAFAGLAAWVAPWPWIHVPLELARLPATGVEPIARMSLGTSIPAAEYVRGAARNWPAYAILALFVPGWIAFAREAVAHYGWIRRLRRTSRSGEPLRALLPAELRATRAEIRIVPGTRFALASGMLRPTIWIGDGFASDAARTLALVHECAHVRRLDPLWLTLITAIKRAYWWNPLVAALSRQAVLMMEAACDRRCVEHFGRRRYIAGLASLMLDTEPASESPLLATARGRHLDVARLGLLRRGMRMRARDHVLILALAAAALGFAGRHLVETPKPAWSRVAIPATPAARTLTALLEAFESGDTTLLDNYLGAYTPQQITWPLHGFTDGVELLEIVASEPHRIEYVVRDKRDGSIATGRLELAGAAPRRTP